MIRGLGPLNSTSIIYSMSIFPSLFSFLSTVFCRTKTGEGGGGWLFEVGAIDGYQVVMLVN